MATTAKRVKDARKPKFKSRQHNRCQLALKGEIPGVVKSSW
jgi:small subunit ribosomal protein S14